MSEQSPRWSEEIYLETREHVSAQLRLLPDEGGVAPDIRGRRVWARRQAEAYLSTKMRAVLAEPSALFDAHVLTEEERKELAQDVANEILGLERLQRLVDDPTIENINVNGYDEVIVKRYGQGRQIEKVPGTDINFKAADDDDDLIRIIHEVAANLGQQERPFNFSSPQLDMQLEDHRLSAVMSVCRRPAISIRRHRHLDPSDARLAKLRNEPVIVLPERRYMIDEQLHEFLRAAVLARKSIVVAGGTNAGKTTLLRALINEIPASERLITIEKAFELGIDSSEYKSLHHDVVAFETRDPNLEGQGEITMRQLVRRTLRMDPDRVIVGEVLGDEVIDMLNVMSQGNDGSLCTIHANSAGGAIDRIFTYAAQAPEKLSWEATMSLIAVSVDFIVFVGQAYVEDADRNGTSGGRALDRFVASILEIKGFNRKAGELDAVEIFAPRQEDGRAVACRQPMSIADLRRHGYTWRGTGDGWKK